MTKQMTKRQLERKQKHKDEKNAFKELTKLKKENPEEYKKIINNQIEQFEISKFRNKDERLMQINRLRKKLVEVGIEKYVSGYKRFNEIAEQFVEIGENIQEDIYIEEMSGVYLVVCLNKEKEKDCSITTKNLSISKQTLEKLKKI